MGAIVSRFTSNKDGQERKTNNKIDYNTVELMYDSNLRDNMIVTNRDSTNMI